MKSLKHSREQGGFIQLEEKMLKEGFNTCLRLPKRGREGLEMMSHVLFCGTQQKEKRQQVSPAAREILIRYQEKLHMCSPPRGGSALATGPQSS